MLKDNKKFWKAENTCLYLTKAIMNPVLCLKVLSIKLYVPRYFHIIWWKAKLVWPTFYCLIWKLRAFLRIYNFQIINNNIYKTDDHKIIITLYVYFFCNSPKLVHNVALEGSCLLLSHSKKCNQIMFYSFINNSSLHNKA